MKILNFIKKHWKSVSAVFAIMIATVIGVVMVKASTVQITVSIASINFTEGQSSQSISAHSYSVVVFSVGGRVCVVVGSTVGVISSLFVQQQKLTHTKTTASTERIFFIISPLPYQLCL